MFGGALGHRLMASTFVASMADRSEPKRSRMSRRYLNKVMFSRSMTATQNLSPLGVGSARSPIAVSIGDKKPGMTMGSSMTSSVGVRLVTGEYSWIESQPTETIGECTPVTGSGFHRNQAAIRRNPKRFSTWPWNAAVAGAQAVEGPQSPRFMPTAWVTGPVAQASFVAFPTWGPMSSWVAA